MRLVHILESAIEHNFFVCNVINFIRIEGSQPLTFQVTTALQHSMQQMTTPPRGLNEIELIDANDNRISVWMAAPNLNMINFEGKCQERHMGIVQPSKLSNSVHHSVWLATSASTQCSGPLHSVKPLMGEIILVCEL